VAPPRLDLFALAPIVCEPDALVRDDARALAHRLARGVPFARLVECRRGAVGDLVIMDVEVEVPKRTDHDIHLEERIGVYFETPPAPPDELAPPEAFALRDDFPRDVPHVNLRPFEHPRSLCLYDTPFAELRSSWTPARFVTLVREWLRLTARGELHAADQPLEPLMMGSCGWIILPNELRHEDAAFGLEARGQIGDKLALVAVPLTEVSQAKRRFVAVCIRASPRTHGVIRRSPATLADLHDLLAPEDDVRGRVAAVVRKWKEEGVPLDAQVAIVLLIPMRRAEGAEPEVDQPWAFLTSLSVEKVGQSLGLWERSAEHGLATMVGGTSAGDGGAAVQLVPLHAYFQHRRKDGARYNGRTNVDERRFVAVGAGALGSQVLDCVARAAFGRWTVVDRDVFLPHNVARHELGNAVVGVEKACGVALGVMQEAAADPNVHNWITVDALAPGNGRAELEQAFEAATAIVDMSASIAVARVLARDVTAIGRRISLFLNPTGTDLVLLAESVDRAVRLDALEMQYYRAVARDSALAGTLRGAVARERYGRSCRDVSTQLPHARVKTLAGIGALALERVVNASTAAIRVWRLDEATHGINAVDVPPYHTIDKAISEWRVVTDHALLARLRELREAKLPNETGGVLLGSVDIARRVVYVADTIPSPPDSKEWPTLYIRGAAGLSNEVERIHEATAGQLYYVGEWHSHPRGYPPLPSVDDLQVFEWITEALDADDHPAVMMIVGEGGCAVFVDSILPNQQPTILPQNGTGGAAP
jgi:Prokaryotic E2 family A/Prokaryotic homologs of the JAB domain